MFDQTLGLFQLTLPICSTMYVVVCLLSWAEPGNLSKICQAHQGGSG
jgi:hypothetical protein